MAAARRTIDQPNRPEDDRRIPYDLDAEAALLGSLLYSPSSWEDVAGLLIPDDFYNPRNQLIYEAIETMQRAHEPVDTTTVATRLRTEGHLETVGGPRALLDLIATTPRASHLQGYAWAVLGASQRRTMIRLGVDITNIGYDARGDDDAGEMVERARRLMHDSMNGMLRSHLVTSTPLLSDLLDTEPEWTMPDWIIPGMLARPHRLVVAAKAGRGKSSFIRQVVCFLAAGYHPFMGDSTHLYRASQRTSLVIDLENDKHGWLMETRPMMEMLRAKSGLWPLPIALHALGGRSYDPVQNRSDRLDLFARLRETRPDLLVIGPLYKLDQKSGAEWHQTAGRIQDLLDDIRETFQCAVMVEAHVGSGGAAVRGAKDWEFWPELVKRLAFFPGDRTRLKVEDVRTPRFRQLYDWWPEVLAKHTNTMLSRATWPDGTFPSDGGPPVWDRSPDWHVRSLAASAGEAF